MVKTKGKRVRSHGEGPLDGSASHLLHRVLQLSSDIYAEETGAGGLTQRQFAVLKAVSVDEGLTQTDLVKATGIDRSTLADMVARMLTKGLLERERSTADARAKAVRLSEQGRAALAEAAPQVEAADKRILSLLPGGKRDGFLKTLKTFAASAEVRAAKAEKKKAKAEKKAAPKAEKKAERKADAVEAAPPAEKSEKKKKKLKKAA